MQLGAPPPPPVNYDDDYVLPVHTVKPLQFANVHSLDARLQFFEAPHVYTFDGIPTSVSVTGLAHQFDKPFVPDEAISLMKNSRTQVWPRFEYAVGAKPLPEGSGPWDASRGALVTKAGRTVAVIQPFSMRDDARLSDVRAMLCAARLPAAGEQTDEDEAFSFERAMADEDIAAHWKNKGRLACNQGTEGHYQAELYFNGLPCRWWQPEMGPVHDFVRDYMIPHGLVAHNTEKEIVCADADVAGSIDLILRDPARGVYHIVDHKRSDKLRLSLRGYGKMHAPLNHLDDCKGAAYALQLSLYRFILERDYDMPIDRLVLLSIHPDVPFCTEVPYLRAEAAHIMETRFALVRARKRAAADHPDRFKCAITGAPLVDAVRLLDGRVAMEKAALLDPHLEPTATPDDDLREAFEAAVRAAAEADVQSPSSLPRAECVSWRRRMPETGIPPFS